MKIYLAARYSRNGEMRQIRDVVETMGYIVTSRWIDCHPGTNGTPELEKSFTTGYMTANPENCLRYAQIDLSDLLAADTVVSFTDFTGGGKGGRHVEFGYALALNKRLIVVGPRENLFHTMTEVTQLNDSTELLDLLRTTSELEIAQ